MVGAPGLWALSCLSPPLETIRGPYLPKFQNFWRDFLALGFEKKSWNIFKINFYVFSIVNFPIICLFLSVNCLNLPPPTGWISGWNAHIVRILQNPIFRNSKFLSIEVKDNPLICFYGEVGIKQQNIVPLDPNKLKNGSKIRFFAMAKTKFS